MSIILPSFFCTHISPSLKSPQNTPREEIQGKTAPAATAVAISAVLDDDDLLAEILIRVAFPTSLVRAALVCTRWLRLASAPHFLRRFRDLHPPSLLGFYVVTAGTYPPRFVPLPQPPELAAVVSRASFDLDNLGSDKFDIDSCNGLLLLTTIHMHPDRPVHTTAVRCPLYPARNTTTLPPVPSTSIIHGDGITYYERELLFLPKGDGHGMSYFCLALGSTNKEQKTVVDVYVLRDDVWAIHSSALTEILKIELLLSSTLIGNGKIYNVATVDNSRKLILLDLLSSSLSLVNLPVDGKSYELSLTDDHRLRLIHVKGSQLRIWLHEMNGSGASNWFLEGTVCLREICANCMLPTRAFKDATSDSSVKLHVVVANSELVFLEMDAVLYLFDIKRRAAKKVYEITPEDKSLTDVVPFMMAWPPKFPLMAEICGPK